MHFPFSESVWNGVSERVNLGYISFIYVILHVNKKEKIKNEGYNLKVGRLGGDS